MIRPWFRHAAVPWKTTVTQTRASGENRVSTKLGVIQGERRSASCWRRRGGRGGAPVGHAEAGGGNTPPLAYPTPSPPPPPALCPARPPPCPPARPAPR